MSNKPNHQQMEVQIMGQSYLLSCPTGGEAALLEAVNRVDVAMCRIRDAGKVKARDRIAVLASLNLAFELAQKEAEPQAQAMPTPSETTAPNDLDPALHTKVQSLIQRLDQTLGQDGQLI
ncbi:cell division protein ZapA [Hydrogenophaga sp.]|uniref:cell division protein ZapA n=1 Tax=Hydrogenophaga sp. TaxID=1904254 RepID=UPI0035B1718D